MFAVLAKKFVEERFLVIKVQDMINDLTEANQGSVQEWAKLFDHDIAPFIGEKRQTRLRNADTALTVFSVLWRSHHPVHEM